MPTPSHRPPTPRILAVGTAVPPHAVPQKIITDFFMRAYTAALPSPERERSCRSLNLIRARCGISQRFTVLPDYGESDPAAFEFFPQNAELHPFPGTADRMHRYERDAVPLAAEACNQALERSGLAADAVTHLVCVSCTGFFAPGPDIRLMRHLGLRDSTARTLVGFMGCHGGFNGLRTAAQIVGADPQAVVLMVCVELCTLHFQLSPIPDEIVANTLFGDGACALVLGSSASHAPGLADLRTMASHVDGDSLDQMSWRIDDHGFRMTLSSDVPRTLHAGAPAFMEQLAAGTGRAWTDLREAAQWSIHPGGVRIIDAIAESLELPDTALQSARDVLDTYGNLSSSTLGFLLERDLPAAAARAASIGQPVPLVAVGFGPGLTVEGALRKVPPAS